MAPGPRAEISAPKSANESTAIVIFTFVTIFTIITKQFYCK